jgi:hypothetical protein
MSKLPRIVSWTLVGLGHERAALDALASVERLVDDSIVIDTSPLEMTSLRGSNVVRWPWRNDFGAARNAGLDFAAEAGADWGCMVDADEWVTCPDPVAVRAFLAELSPTVAVVLVHATDGSHTRERLFRLPSRYRFMGRTHECYAPNTDAEQAFMPQELLTWDETPKTPEQLQAKFTRDVEMLKADIIDNPKDGRAHYYLGSSLQGLGRHEEAVDAFRECIAHDSLELGAWACFRAAESLLELERYDRALDAAIAGMARDAGIAELPWIAAIASLRVGRLEQARCWACLAEVHGKGSEAERRRVGFRVPKGLTFGPKEVLECVEDLKAPRC